MQTFHATVWEYYRQHSRPMPWRTDVRPYYVVVSEIMLQQTQVDRVIPKFTAFIALFPDFSSLASAPLAAVITAWQGLGYNRRARFLHELAQHVITDYHGQLPTDIATLETLPGIGPATAAAIATYAFNQPLPFIETNVRSVFLHHFFGDRTDVSDKELLPLVEQALDRDNPREWYWALMDYGVWIKKTYDNPSRRSRHHTKQNTFAGSNRQKRGQIVAYLTAHKQASLSVLAEVLHTTSATTRTILASLIADKLVILHNRHYQLP